MSKESADATFAQRADTGTDNGRQTDPCYALSGRPFEKVTSG